MSVYAYESIPVAAPPAGQELAWLYERGWTVISGDSPLINTRTITPRLLELTNGWITNFANTLQVAINLLSDEKKMEFSQTAFQGLFGAEDIPSDDEGYMTGPISYSDMCWEVRIMLRRLYTYLLTGKDYGNLYLPLVSSFEGIHYLVQDTLSRNVGKARVFARAAHGSGTTAIMSLLAVTPSNKPEHGGPFLIDYSQERGYGDVQLKAEDKLIRPHLEAGDLLVWDSRTAIGFASPRYGAEVDDRIPFVGIRSTLMPTQMLSAEDKKKRESLAATFSSTGPMCYRLIEEIDSQQALRRLHSFRREERAGQGPLLIYGGLSLTKANLSVDEQALIT